MKFKAMAVISIALAMLFASACATKKYVRNRVNERVTPLENRAGELEETSRRNTQDISRISRDVEDVRGRADRAHAPTGSRCRSARIDGEARRRTGGALGS